MLLPLPAFTDSMPSTLTWAQTGGASVGGAATVEFVPYEHAMTGSVLAGADNVVSSISQESMLGAALAGSATTYSFETPTTYEHDMVGAVVAGAATTWFMEGQFFINLTAGGATEYVFENGPILTGTLPLLEIALDAYLENNQMAATFPKVLALEASGVDGPYVTSFALRLPVPTANFHKAADLAITPPLLTAAFTADYITVAALAGVLPSVEAGTWAGTTAVVAYMGAVLPRPQAALDGTIGVSGALTPSFPIFTSQLAGSMGSSAVLGGAFPVFTGAFTGLLGVNGSLVLVLPKLTGAFAWNQAAAYLQTYVANLANNVLTSFTNYGFTSVAEFDGKFYGTKADGIYLLDGQTDDTTPIPLEVDLGNLDFGNRNQKRVSDLYMAYNTDGKMKVTVSTDETSPYSYQMLPYGVETIKQRRVALGKGMRGKYWNIKIENVDGADLRVESLHLRVAPQNRRI